MGDGLPGRWPLAAPSEPTLRGAARRAGAIGGARVPAAGRRAQAAGHRDRRLRARLWSCPPVLRILPRARSAARLPLGRPDHGHAAVAAADACRHRVPVGCAQGQARAGDVMADETPPLEAEIRRRITVVGAMPVAQYMSLCLTHPQHGYYMRRDPIGARGDFITAPEISQMFGELIGLWTMAVWTIMGEPENVRLI